MKNYSRVIRFWKRRRGVIKYSRKLSLPEAAILGVPPKIRHSVASLCEWCYKNKTNFVSEFENRMYAGEQFLSTFPEIKTKSYSLNLGPNKHREGLPLEVELMSNGKSLGFIELNFEESQGEKVMEVSIQGGTKEVRNEQELFAKENSKPWHEVIFQTLFEHAKKSGFKTVKMLRPEQKPFVGFSAKPAATTSFIYSMAKKAGFSKKGKWFVKNL